MTCDKCGSELEKGQGAIMAQIPGRALIISHVEILNCPCCDNTEVRVVEG